MTRQDIDERYEIYHVKEDPLRVDPTDPLRNLRSWIFVATTDTKEGIGTALVTMAEDRWEAGIDGESRDHLPVFAIYDAGTERWITGPADPTRAPREYSIHQRSNQLLAQYRDDQDAHERMTGQHADDTGYSLDDPKHPDHHDVFSGLADDR